MRNGFLRLLLFIAVIGFAHSAAAQLKTPASTDTYFTTENYYKVKWGQADEFIELWKKNHYPLLKKTQENGDIISIKAEKPVLHSSEETRWDFKVTIVWKNADLAVGNQDPTSRYKAQLYPDSAKLKKDEQYRFSLLLAHWDVLVQPVPLQ